MLFSTGDIFRCGRDPDGFRLDRCPPLNPRYEKQRWEWVPPAQVVSQWDAALNAGQIDDHLHLLAFLALFEGERQQRRTIERNLTTGRRNIALDCARFNEALQPSLELLLSSDEWGFLVAIDLILLGKDESSIPVADRDRYNHLNQRFNAFEENSYAAVRRMMQRYGLPEIPADALVGYEIDEQIIAMPADEACREYLCKKQGTEREPIFAGRMAVIAAHLKEHFRSEAVALIKRIKAKPVNLLSSLSLSSEKGKLLVSLVNPYGRHVRVEAWKFLKSIKEHGQTQRWGELSRKSADEPEPLVKFNNQKVGVLYTKLWPERFCFEVICRPEVIGDDGPKAKSTAHELSWFYVEPEYMVSLAVAIERLLEDQKRFDELLEKSLTVVVHDPLQREFF